MEMPAPQNEHKWLQRLIGSWTFEGECSMGPDKPPMKNQGSEVVKTAKYQDIIEWIDDNHRILRSQYMGSDGEWVPFMKSTYQRVDI